MLKLKIVVFAFFYSTSLYSDFSQPLYLAVTVLPCFSPQQEESSCKIIYSKPRATESIGKQDPQLAKKACAYKREKKTRTTDDFTVCVATHSSSNKRKIQKSFNARTKQKDRRYLKKQTGESHPYGKLSQKHAAKTKRKAKKTDKINHRKIFGENLDLEDYILSQQELSYLIARCSHLVPEEEEEEEGEREGEGEELPFEYSDTDFPNITEENFNKIDITCDENKDGFSEVEISEARITPKTTASCWDNQKDLEKLRHR
jgi:hypothetical protein